MDNTKAADPSEALIVDVRSRVLLLEPSRRDGIITKELLTKAGLHCEICASFAQMIALCAEGVGAILLTDMAINAPGIEQFLAMLQQQPPWSDVPVIMLTPRGVQSPAASRVVQLLRNVTLLERPSASRSVVSAAQTAVRARLRQYQLRDQLEELRRAQNHAQQLRWQLELAVDASELGIFHIELPEGRLIWSDRCKAHFWLAADAEVDLPKFYSILHPDDRDRARDALEECIVSGSQHDIEYRAVSPEGEIRWIRTTGRSYRDGHGRPLGFDGTTQDITQSRRAAEDRQQLLESEQAARREAERVSRMKDEFLATLSHELRTPLNAIFGWTQLLRVSKSNPAAVDEAVEVIDRNVRVQTQLIEDLLDMSRIISGKIRLDMQLAPVQEVLRAAIAVVAPAIELKHIHLAADFDSELGQIKGDSGRLQQVFWNLLTNAIKFTPQGGNIALIARHCASHIEITITDDGEGISAEFLPHLFERFSQSDGSSRRMHGGLGLGLSIVKNLVELHGGTIQARSEGEGRGATFTVCLPTFESDAADPCLEADSVKQNASADIEPGQLRGVKVLVIDDEPDARELVQRFVSQVGATVTTAGSASEAEELLSHFQPDVIVSDIGMPGRDGYQFIQEVRRRKIDAPAIALTAFARNEDRIRALEAGYQAHLTKPIDPTQLVEVLRELVASSKT